MTGNWPLWAPRGPGTCVASPRPPHLGFPCCNVGVAPFIEEEGLQVSRGQGMGHQF